MGVITNDGEKLAPITLTRIEFAAGTPYHTTLKRKRQAAERIFPSEIATVVKTALANVVNEGTARRLRGAFALDDGTLLPIGGKTGTGDHRLEVYAANGSVIESKVMNRTATFAFYLGARFFGVMTVFVPGEAAGQFHFTSAIAVQIVKDMEPALRPLILGNEKPEPAWKELVAAFDAEAAAQVGMPPKVSALPPPGAPLTLPAGAVPGALPSSATQPAKATPKPLSDKAATGKPAVKSPIKPAPKPVVKPTGVESSEPPPAPPPPQVDKPDPLPPPAAPPPSKPAGKEKHVNPWLVREGEGFDFMR
jgi:membrane peptidoglycan carboxypeptidase